MYTIPAIPTRYNGVNFRSRLEAKWAAFFDLLGWRWDYEPVDFPGWIPDFVIYGKRNPVYVEVKPFDLKGTDAWKTQNPNIANVLKKIGSATKQKHELMLLGSNGLFGSASIGGWCIGLLGESIEGYNVVWGGCLMTSDSQGKLGFCSDIGDWTDRISGEYVRAAAGNLEESEEEHLLEYWKGKRRGDGNIFDLGSPSLRPC